MAKESIKLIANNKKAYHDYFIEDKYEAGIELFGTEVKSIRMGKCSIKESFIRIEKGQMYIYGMHINPYEKGNIFNKDPLRVRRLLMHRTEISRLDGRLGVFGAVFNTVPSLVLDRPLLMQLPKNCLCVELASTPGIDQEAAEKLGLPCIWARSLPGRLVPATAAAAICDAVFYIIKERGDPE